MFHSTVTGESKEDTQVGAVISVHDLSEMQVIIFFTFEGQIRVIPGVGFCCFEGAAANAFENPFMPVQ